MGIKALQLKFTCTRLLLLKSLFDLSIASRRPQTKRNEKLMKMWLYAFVVTQVERETEKRPGGIGAGDLVWISC